MANVYKVMRGVDKITEALLNLAPELRRGPAMKALRAGGRVVQKATLPHIPVLKKPIYRRGVLIRKPGTVKAALKVRSSRDTNRTGDVGVFINVRPAKGADRGKFSPNDPFYWRWLNFGTKRTRAYRFLERGAEVLPNEALQAVEQTLGPAIERLNRPGGKP